ncbi:MAG: hypothetical protein ACJ74Q_15370 [Pyrinomonadaceae bacterium]
MRLKRRAHPPRRRPARPDVNRLDERARHVRDHIWYVPQAYLDELSNTETPAFGEQLWVRVLPWGGRSGWDTKRGSYWWGVMGVELRGLAGEMLVVSDEWMRREADCRRQEESEEMERRINSPWNIERAARLAKTTIELFKQLPSYTRRRFLIDAFIEDEYA